MPDKDMYVYGQSRIDLCKLLQGGYETDRLPKNFTPERIVPDFAFNILNPLGLLYRPIVDEDFLAKGGTKPDWPDGKHFAVCLTHDVDVVSSNSFSQSVRRYANNLINSVTFIERVGGLLGLMIDVAQMIAHAKAPDPIHCYERWLEVEEEIGARSTFFFWPGWNAVSKHHPSDCTYNLTDRLVFDGQKGTVADMIREIDRRGWEIGLHPSWYSFDNAEEMKRQKVALEKVLGHEVVSVRQHYLHYDIRVTPRVQAEAGFKYDSSLGFNDNIGFRFGTSYPWKLYDLKAKTALPVTEIPLIIQDGALLLPKKGMRLDEETAFQYIVQLTEEIQGVGGVLTLLWHPQYILTPDWWNLYLHALSHLKNMNAWFGPVREVGEKYTIQKDGKPLTNSLASK